MIYSRMAIEERYTFDDVLIEPAESDMEPHEADVSIALSPTIRLAAPILSAAMDTVTEVDMVIALGKAGGLGVLHRNCTIEQQVSWVQEIKKEGVLVGAACGPFDEKRAKSLCESGVDALIIDCAHGHNTKVIASVAKMRALFPDVYLIAGNIVTEKAAQQLAAHVDAVKVGVGPGSICTTRIVSGVGVPQLSAIQEVVKGCAGTEVKVIADGGIRTPGDMAKALAAGAHAVMLGSVLGATKESPGERIEKEGVVYKTYRGMGSRSVLEARMSDDRYLQKNRTILPEGIEAALEEKGTVQTVVEEYIGGLMVSMGYVGAHSLSEFHQRAHFIRVTAAGVNESRPHSVHALR